MRGRLFNRLPRGAVVLQILSQGVLCIALASNDSGSAMTEQYGSGSSSLLNVYQRVLSPAKGGNTCPMHPSCSQYAKLAFAGRDPVSAFTRVCDRFVRCGRDLSQYERVSTTDGVRWHDAPVAVTASAALPDVPGTPAGASGSSDTSCASFAQMLFKEKKYQLATLEFERLAHISTDQRCRSAAMEGIVSCAFYAEPLNVFTDRFYRAADSLHADSAALGRCGLLLAKRYFSAGDYDGAVGALHSYAVSADTDLRAERYFLTALSHLCLRRPDEALLAADSIRRDSQFSAFAGSLHREVSDFYAGERSPNIAGALSMLLPGAGYFYVKRPATAAAAFLINGLLIWTTVEFFQDRRYGAGATALVLGSGFYCGAISGSVRAARDYNMNSRKKKCALFIDEVRYRW